MRPWSWEDMPLGDALGGRIDSADLGTDLVIAGTDTNGLLHIRTFDHAGDYIDFFEEPRSAWTTSCPPTPPARSFRTSRRQASPRPSPCNQEPQAATHGSGRRTCWSRPIRAVSSAWRHNRRSNPGPVQESLYRRPPGRGRRARRSLQPRLHRRAEQCVCPDRGGIPRGYRRPAADLRRGAAAGDGLSRGLRRRPQRIADLVGGPHHGPDPAGDGRTAAPRPHPARLDRLLRFRPEQPRERGSRLALRPGHDRRGRHRHRPLGDLRRRRALDDPGRPVRRGDAAPRLPGLRPLPGHPLQQLRPEASTWRPTETQVEYKVTLAVGDTVVVEVPGGQPFDGPYQVDFLGFTTNPADGSHPVLVSYPQLYARLPASEAITDLVTE